MERDKGREPLTDDPAYYEGWLAAGGAGSVCAPARERWEVEPPGAGLAHRIPLKFDLERRLAERAGKPRQFRKGRVNTATHRSPATMLSMNIQGTRSYHEIFTERTRTPSRCSTCRRTLQITGHYSAGAVEVVNLFMCNVVNGRCEVCGAKRARAAAQRPGAKSCLAKMTPPTGRGSGDGTKSPLKNLSASGRRWRALFDDAQRPSGVVDRSGRWANAEEAT